MALTGEPRTFHDKFLFTVEIDGVAHAGFQRCSEIRAEVAKIEHYEGGSPIPDKSPGRVTVPDVTLSRGATRDKDLYDWYLQVLDASAGTGQATPQFKRNIDVVQKDRAGNELERWRLFGAWPTAFSAGDWDNTADDHVIESLTLAYDFPSLVRE